MKKILNILILFAVIWVMGETIDVRSTVSSITSALKMDNLELAPGDFTITTTPKNETCTNNGGITVEVQNAIVGATYSIEVFTSTNLSTAIRTYSVNAASTTFSHNFAAMGYGNYVVRVTESTSGTSHVKNENVSIIDEKTTLSYRTTKNLGNCSFDVQINVESTPNTADTYELRDSTGSTVIYGPQTSNIFASVPSGNYTVYVKDICGQYVTQVVSVEPIIVQQDVSVGLTSKTCTTYNAQFNFYNNININNTTITYASPLAYTIEFDNGTPSISGTYDYTLGEQPIYEVPAPTSGNSYNATVTFTDACGNTSTPKVLPITYLERRVASTVIGTLCGQYALVSPDNLPGNNTLTFTRTPEEFIPSEYSDQFTGTNMTSEPYDNQFIFGSDTNTLPEGDYTGYIMSECGEEIEFGFYISEPLIEIKSSEFLGCDVGFSSLQLHGTANNDLIDLESINIIDAPASYTGPTILERDEIDTSYYIANDLIQGTYRFEGTYSCNGVEKKVYLDKTIIGLIESSNLTASINCNSFTIDGIINSNADMLDLYIERFDPLTNQWINTGIYLDTYFGNFNHTVATHNVNSSPISISGKLRVIAIDSGNPYSDIGYCTRVLYEFEAYFGIEATPYVFACGTNSISVAIDARGNGNLNYKIIEKDGVPLIIDNGSNPVFSNLDIGTYMVEVSDTCGSTQIIEVSGDIIQTPEIKASNICEGENGMLYLPELSFMNVTWTKDGNPLPAGVTLSNNGYTLNFEPYTKPDHIGVYEATLTYKTPSECPAFVTSFTLSANNDTNPQAGTGNIVYIDPTTLTEPVNLFDHITGPYDTGGTWTETTNPVSGLLVDNLWRGQSLTSGTYTFQYSVDGTCSGNDTTTVTIIFSELVTMKDEATVPSGATVVAIPNVAANDQLNGVDVVIGTDPGQVTLSVDPDSSVPTGLEFNPDTGEVKVLATAAPGTYSFEYQICVNGSNPAMCNSETVTITVTDSAILKAVEDINQTPNNTPVLGNVLTNDVSSSNASVSSATAVGPNNSVITIQPGTTTEVYGENNEVAGTILINADGTYTFTPNENYTGDVVINYTATNLDGLNDDGSLTIKVIPTVNIKESIAPIAQNDVATANMNTPVVVKPLLNDSDPGGDMSTATISAITQGGNVITNGGSVSGIDENGNIVPNAGTITVNAQGEITFTPTNNFVGKIDPISYTLNDAEGLSDTAEIYINVANEFESNNNNTYANDDAIVGVAREILQGNVLTNDSDPEGDALTVTSATVNGVPMTIGTSTALDDIGRVKINSDGTYAFSPLYPSTNFVGTIVVVYTVCDSGNPQACDTATLYITALDTDSFCYKPAEQSGVVLNTNVGISTIGQDENWPQNRKGAFIAIESKTKGLVIPRMTTNEMISIANPQVGMTVYDTVADCMKVYGKGPQSSTLGWYCYTIPTCND